MTANSSVLLFLTLAFGLSTLLTLLMVLPVLRTRDKQNSLLTLNVQVFRERLAELEEDHASGRVDAETFQALKTELERQLLSLQPEAAMAAGKEHPGRKSMVGLLVGAPLLAVLLYMGLAWQPALATWWQVQRHTTPVVEKLFAGQKPTPEELQTQTLPDMVRVMQARLQTHPDDVDGWYMLGMSYLQGQLAEPAMEAFDHALHLDPQRTDIALAYAQTLLFTRQGRLDDQSRALLAAVLDRHPEHEGALLLMGMGAYRAGDMKTALQFLPVLKQIHAARTGESASEALHEIDQIIALAHAGGEATADTSGVRVTVRLADTLKGKMPDGATLFVFARALNGPPMPLAAVRRPVANFPVDVVLDDSQAMTPALKLSQFPSVVVSARISRSGSPTGVPGDLEAIAVPLTQNGKIQRIDVVISQVRP